MQTTVTILGFEVDVYDIEYTPPVLALHLSNGESYPPEGDELFFGAKYPTGEEVGDDYILDLIADAVMDWIKDGCE